METRTLLKERLRRSRDWSAAIDELEKELENSGSKPEQSERLFELARVTEDVVPERERALALYQRAWKLHPDNLKALSRAREVYGELGRFEMVAKLGEMELKSPAAAAHLAGIVGEALLDSGQKDKAQAVLERAIERTPDSWRVKEAIAALNYDPEFWADEVERLTEQAEKAEPQQAARMLLRAARVIRLEAPDDPRLEETVKQILAMDLDEPSANFLYESLLAAQERWDELEKLHERRIDSRPDTATKAEASRSFALEWIQRFKDKDRGARFFARALRTVASNGASSYRDSFANGPLRSTVAAFAMLRQVYGEKSEWSAILDLADAVLVRLSDEDKLYVAVQAGLIAWQKTNDKDRARRFFRAAAEIESSNPDVEDFKQQVGLGAEPAAPSAVVDTVTAPAWPPPPVSPHPASAPAPMPASASPAASGNISVAAVTDRATQPVAGVPPPGHPSPSATPPAAAAVVEKPAAPARVEEIPADLEGAMAKAKEAEGGADKGAAAWKAVVAAHPTKLAPRRGLARALRGAGAWAQLVDALKDEESKAAQTPDEKATAFRELAEAFGKLNNENQVIASLTSSLAQDGGQLGLYDQLASIYENKKRWPDLVKVLGEKAERVEGNAKTAIYLQIANLYLERFSNQAEAIKAFERVLELDPNNVQAVDHLLAVYEKRRDWEKLIKLKEAEIDRSPANERAAKTIAVAQMAASKVKKPEICTFWWEKVLDVDPHHDEALAELYKLYERNKEWTKLADVCSRQAEGAKDDKAKIDALQRLGLLYTEKVEDSAKAIDAWQRLLAVDKENRRAQDALKKLYVTEARWDELEEFYRSRGKTEEYVRVLEREVEAGPEQHRLELAMTIAVLYRDELQKADRAMRAFEKVLSLDAENLAAAEALIPLYETSRDPRKLVGVLEIQLKATPRADKGLRRERLEKLAEYNEDKLKDKAAAFKWWLEAHREDHEAESIRTELERLAQETGAWQELVDAYAQSLPKFKSKPDALPLMLVIARVDEQELGEIDRALDMNRAILDIDGANEQALDALERLYLGKDRFQDLLGVYAKKLELTADGELRIQIQSKIGQLYEDEIKDDGKAIAAYMAILDAALGEGEAIALAALDRIYLRNGQWKQLAEILGRELVIVDPGDPNDKPAHLELKYRLGQVREQHLGDVAGAIDAYRDILDLDPSHARARAALEARLGDKDHKLPAAGILEPIYEQLGEWGKLVDVHEIQHAAEPSKDRLRRVALLMRIGELHRTRLGAADKAFDAYARSFREDPSVEGAKLQLEDLAGLIDDGWPRLVKLFEDALSESARDKEIDPNLAHELALKVADAYEERLGDSDKAVSFYKRALAIEPDDLGALGSLEGIFARDEKYPELLDVYRRKADIASEPDERLAILFKIASIHEEMLGSPDEAISAYQEVLGQDADNLQSLRALDRLYGSQKQWRDLGDNLTRQLTLVEDDRERVGLLYRLAQLRETHLGEVAAAVETYRQVLDLDPSNHDAIAALERLIAQPDQELAIANILEPIYKSGGDWKKQISVYEIMVRHAFDPQRKIELLHQISELHELGGDAGESAFATYSRALREDPRNEQTQAQLDRLARGLDRWKELVALYDQVAKEANDDDLKVQLLTKLAQIHELELGDDKSAVATYQRILQVAPGSVDAASAIQAIHERNGDWPSLVGALKKKAEILLDVPAKKQLLYRAAQIEEEVLTDPDAAIATFRSVLDADEIDPVAMDALERLYIRLERWEPLKDIYAKKADLAEDPADKKQMLYVLGQVYDRELGDVAKSIETYQAILDLDADELPAIQALDRLYGQAERWYDLLGNLERQVELADSTGEMVGLKFRIGHLWQTRLGDVARAIESYREALEMDPQHAETLAALDGLLHGKTEPVMAARVLEPIYEAGGEHGKLVDVLEVMVQFNDDPLARVELLHRLTALHEQRLDDPKNAFGALGRALKDDSGNALTLGHLERLADATQSWKDLAGLYQGEADKTIDVPRQVDLLTRLARVHEEELTDVDKSIATYRRILEAEFDNKPAVLALDRLYTQTSRWRELSEILRREIQLADSDDEIVLLQFRLGQTLEESLGDSKAAVDVYREILTSHPAHAPTLTALEELFLEGKHQAEIGAIVEPLYETAGEFEKLHRIYEVQLGKLTGGERQSMYQRLAELAETRLYDGQRAFAWWGEAAVEDPTWDQAIEEVERLARETAAWDELVAIYTRALERHPGTGAKEKEQQKRTLLRLARVYEAELRDAHRAVETHLRVLEIDARDPEALAALDRLYLGAGMYDELVEILRRRIEISQDPDESIELQFRRGAIFSDALGDLDASLKCYQAVLDQESRNRRALEAQEGIYFRREDWQKLYDTYEKLIDTADGDDEMADVYARMARIASDALGQDEKAMDLLGRVLDIRGEDPAALAALSDLYTRKDKWEELVEVIERQVAASSSDQDQIALYKRLGRVWADKLGRERSALDAWLCADRLDPRDLETLRALAALYQSTQSWDELSQTLNRIVEVGQDTGQINEDQTIELYAQLGQLEGEILGRVDDAVDAWRRVLSLDPSDFRALGALEQLFTREARWEEAIEVMEKRALVQDDERARIDTMLQAAATWEEKVENLTAAAEIYERVRGTEPANATASERLEAIYRAQYKWPELSEVLLERVDQRDDVQEQITILNQVAKIYETEIGDQDAAFVVLQAAFKRDFSHEDTAKELERLATATNRWAELLEEYSHQVAELEGNDRQSAADLWVKIGRWYGEHLSHIEYAIHSVQQALRIDPSHTGALAAVAELQRKRGSWGELIETLSKHAAVEANPDKRTDLYLNLADLYENQIQDSNQAIAAYQQAVAANPESKPALVALERLYRRTEQWDALIDVLTRRAALETEDREVVRLRLEIGQIWDLRLFDAGQAIGAYNSVLEVDASNLSALRALEQLYDKTSQPEKYLEVLEAQLDATPTDAERVSLYERMAAAWEERFGKLDRAAEALEKIVALDPRNFGAFRELARLYFQAGKWESLVETYRNHIAATTDVATRMDLYCAMGQIYEQQLGDSDRAIEAYLEVLNFDADEPRALDALGRLYEKIGEWDRAIDVMGSLVRLSDDPRRQVDLYSRIGRIHHGELRDADGAESNLLRALAIDPGHVATMETLVKLYSDRGDWLKAAQMMVRAEQYTPVVLDKVRLLYDAARLYQDKLRQPEAAKQLYASVIALDPEHVDAGRPLAEIYFENEEWAPLSPVIGMLVRKVAQSRPDPKELNELYYRAARTAGELGDSETALHYYESAYNIDSTYLPVLLGRADLLFKMGDWEGAGKIYQTILVQHRDSQDEAAVVGIYYRLGMVRQNLGERKKALNMFEKALEIDPSHRDTLGAVIALQQQGGDWEAVVHAKRSLMATADDKEKVALLDEIGGIYHQQLQNAQKAIGAYLEALEVSPEDHTILQKVQDLYAETKQWRKVVENIQRFIELEADPVRKGAYYYAAGTISRDELKGMDEAMEFFNHALDSFFAQPERLPQAMLTRALKAFAAIDTITTTKRDWATQQRAYRNMIKRLGNSQSEQLAKLRISLLDALAEIYRSRLKSYKESIAAFELASQLDPENTDRAEKMAELYLVAGPEYADKAIEQHMKMLRVEPFKYDSYKALRRIYMDTHQYDKTWCLCNTLAFLKKADPDELQFYEQYKPRGLVKAKAMMSTDSWGKLVHPDENRYVSAIFAAVWQGVAAMKAFPHKDLGIKRKDRRQLAGDPLMFSKLFYYVGQVLNVPLPEVFIVEDNKQADIQLANFVDKNELCPAFIVRPHLMQGKNEREIAFLSAKRLTFMRPEYYLKMLLPTNTEVRVALSSAIAMINPKFPVAQADLPNVQAYLPEVKARMQPQMFEHLAVVVNRFIQNAPTDSSFLVKWGHAVDATSYRSGFVVSGDLEVAARMVSAEPVSMGGPQVKDKIKELVLFSISEDYFAVRAQMGLTIG